jgi:hypothetical protein
MGRTPPPTKYVTLSTFNKFVKVMNDFVFEQRQFNKEVRDYMDKHS